jgi:nitroreductase
MNAFFTKLHVRSTLGAIRHRISANHFAPNKYVSDNTIRQLVFCATQAPSSFNLQPWRFLALTEWPDKHRLMKVACGQRKLVEAAVTFVVLGDLLADSKLPDILRKSVKAGVFDESTATQIADQCNQMYADPGARRDEAIRSASMAAMTLMLAAEAKGLVSCPLIEFDPQGVRREFHIAERYLPVMLVAVGYPASGNRQRKPRLPLHQVLAFGVGWPWATGSLETWKTARANCPVEPVETA